MPEIAIVEPGTDLVPDGWWRSMVVPWADRQTDDAALARGMARVVGLEAAYRTLNADTLELVKARRYLEIRWGELLGPGELGANQHSEGSHASEGSLDKDDRFRFRQLAAGKARAMDILDNAADSDEVTRAMLLTAINGAHVGNNSGDNEWYTPVDYIKAASVVMGGIELDPASSIEANEIVGARRFFTVEDNGLEQPWRGTVWMNPPYAQPLIDKFCTKLAHSYHSGDVAAATVLINNATETGWFHTLAGPATAMCFPRGRVRFWHPDKKSAPLQGQTVVYMGRNTRRFRAEFARFGFTVAL